MSPTFWNTMFAIGIAQGAFLVVALLLRRNSNPRATGALMAIVAVFTGMTAFELLEGAHDGRSVPLITYLQINADLAIGPLLLLFVRSVFEPGRRAGRRDALHFLPLLLGLAAWGTTWALVDDRRRPFGVELDTVTTFFLVVKVGFFAAYAVAVFRILLPLLRDPRGLVIGRRRVELAWLRPWLDPELSLGDLAAAIGCPENRVSALINEGLATSFYDLLGRYRLTEFERLARDPRLDHVTILELALRAGFNSKASFYRKFREVHDTTPRAYREAK